MRPHLILKHLHKSYSLAPVAEGAQAHFTQRLRARWSRHHMQKNKIAIAAFYRLKNIRLAAYTCGGGSLCGNKGGEKGARGDE